MHVRCFLPRNGDSNGPVTALVSQRLRSSGDGSSLQLSGSWSYVLIITPPAR